MRLFLFFFVPFIIYANTITIKGVFKNKNRICIYNNTNTKIDLDLKDNDNSSNQVCLYFQDYTGTLDSNCSQGEATLSVDNLRKKVIYYISKLDSDNTDDEYNLTIKGDDNGIMASECPTNALSKVANTTPSNIASAMILAGVLSSFLLFAGVIYAFIPSEDNDYNEDRFL